MCETGPTVVIMPDDLWFGGVGLENVEEIVDLLRVSLQSADAVS